MGRRQRQEHGMRLEPDQLRELLRVLDESGVRVFRYEDPDIKLEIERGAPRDASKPVGESDR